MINNFHYTLVLSGSTGIAESYGMKKYVSLITWANVFFGIGANIVNAFVLPLLSYNIRVTATSLMTVFALLLVSFSWDIGGHNPLAAFIVTLIGVTFIGIASNYGSSVFLGYMERLPSWQIGFWSSGTGLSGVVASLMYLGMTSANLSNRLIFLISITFVAVYWGMYFFGFKLPFCVESSNNENVATGEEDGTVTDNYREYICKAMTNWSGMSWTSIIPARRKTEPKCLREMRCRNEAAFVNSELPDELENDSVPLGRWAAWKRDVWPLIKEMHRQTLWNNFNLALVYVAEYAVQFIAPFSFPCNQIRISKSFWLKNSFVITQFCYQFGVLISRSSLVCFRIRHVWIMSVIQVINGIAWFVQAKFKFMSDPNDMDRELKFAFGLFAWMIFVGLMGGASYVNVFYNILEETLEEQRKEEKKVVEFLSLRGNNGNEEVRQEGATAAAAADSDLLRNDVVDNWSTEVEEALKHVATEWKEKRDLAMNIGAIYSSIGITIGSFFDLFFTLVVLKGDECT